MTRAGTSITQSLICNLNLTRTVYTTHSGFDTSRNLFWSCYIRYSSAGQCSVYGEVLDCYINGISPHRHRHSGFQVSPIAMYVGAITPITKNGLIPWACSAIFITVEYQISWPLWCLVRHIYRWAAGLNRSLSSVLLRSQRARIETFIQVRSKEDIKTMNKK